MPPSTQNSAPTLGVDKKMFVKIVISLNMWFKRPVLYKSIEKNGTHEGPKVLKKNWTHEGLIIYIYIKKKQTKWWAHDGSCKMIAMFP